MSDSPIRGQVTIGHGKTRLYIELTGAILEPLRRENFKEELRKLAGNYKLTVQDFKAKQEP